MKRALLVTDIQNDFLPGGALAVPDGDAIIPYVLKLMRDRSRYDLLVVIQDWHPRNHGSFASNHPGAEPFALGELAGLPQVFWPDHCVQGTKGAHLHPQISDCLAEMVKGGAAAIIIQKGQDSQVDSYSAFFDNARRHDTGLDRALEEYAIEAVDIVGLAFDYCVRATALDAASLGYRTRVLLNGTRSIDTSVLQAVIAELTAAGVICLEE
ncbi:bifunctional nicotinamidase/pyrazinamidase [Desulfofustis limnaeus]|jgi:nicotinamidase/pyrazinamidase|uniref:nicotinamidase n=1 Tax=Desulfofustis limnaeus TaxID=2740163 RepID=A0ABM7WDH0_9BACT|nr:bifunctional nicotinamidase/pyrazinamidase [Desulfofustis limnaeus]MDX9894113.1 bifunctional nicotinamidase/pyrazinamidase [Desulfofustis sp.]BDD89014.1 nicotinamidase/pyrazinamidase [Desulfofustis limnaeus]